MNWAVSKGELGWALRWTGVNWAVTRGELELTGLWLVGNWTACAGRGIYRCWESFRNILVPGLHMCWEWLSASADITHCELCLHEVETVIVIGSQTMSHGFFHSTCVLSCCWPWCLQIVFAFMSHQFLCLHRQWIIGFSTPHVYMCPLLLLALVSTLTHIWTHI